MLCVLGRGKRAGGDGEEREAKCRLGTYKLRWQVDFQRFNEKKKKRNRKERIGQKETSTTEAQCFQYHACLHLTHCLLEMLSDLTSVEAPLPLRAIRQSATITREIREARDTA